MTFKRDDLQKAGSLIADGSLTVQQAGEFKDALTKALNEVDRLEINLNKVIEVDLTCLQILCATHRACIKTNKTLKISHQQTEALQKAVKDAGYERHRGCKDIGENNQCLWLSGGTHG
jgi:ABC-type transporter Mla MlaB component